jgi:hypothetical protein
VTGALALAAFLLAPTALAAPLDDAAGAPALAPLEVQPPGEATPEDAEVAALRAELIALRAELDQLRADVESAPAPPAHELALGRLQQVSAPSPSAGTRHLVGLDEVVPDATSFGEDLVILGTVEGNATAFGGDVRVAPTGAVGGDAVSFGGEVVVDDGGVVRGNRVAALPEPQLGALTGLDASSFADSLYRRLLFFLSFAGAGVLVIGLFPNRVSRIAEAIEANPMRSAALGGILGTALAMLAVLFAVMLVGLPLSAALVAALGVAWLTGFVALCQVVGDRLPFRQRHHGRWLAFLLGVLALTFVSAVPLLGVLLIAAASFIGVGAALTTGFGAR